MSEMEDPLLEGLVCERAGIYLEKAVGYPRKCRTCERLTDRENEKREEEGEGDFSVD